LPVVVLEEHDDGVALELGGFCLLAFEGVALGGQEGELGRAGIDVRLVDAPVGAEVAGLRFSVGELQLVTAAGERLALRVHHLKIEKALLLEQFRRLLGDGVEELLDLVGLDVDALVLFLLLAGREDGGLERDELAAPEGVAERGLDAFLDVERRRRAEPIAGDHLVEVEHVGPDHDVPRPRLDVRRRERTGHLLRPFFLLDLRGGQHGPPAGEVEKRRAAAEPHASPE
jgi:hypothetical protein